MNMIDFTKNAADSSKKNFYCVALVVGVRSEEKVVEQMILVLNLRF